MNLNVLLLDNYDSFVFNLARYCEELGAPARVIRSHQITLDDINKFAPSHIIISPGPCTPDEAGISLQCIRAFYQQIPILGVCLGHQAIAQALGGKVVRAQYPMHGKVDRIHHLQQGIFSQLPQLLEVTRYHSLIVEKCSLPDCLEVTAWSNNGEIMALQHKSLPLWGVQFHPEAVLTAYGHAMLGHFLRQKLS